jgi:hypothetical protein
MRSFNAVFTTARSLSAHGGIDLDGKMRTMR